MPEARLAGEKIFAPLVLGAFSLAHRVVMPAMARGRAAPAGGVPTPMMVSYYAQRATCGGLIVCEPVAVSPGMDDGRCPGLYSAEQVNHWRGVTDAVHARGGLVLAQLGHGALRQPLELGEVDGVLESYRNAAENAGDAGFDGVELHADADFMPQAFFSPSTDHAPATRAADASPRWDLLQQVTQTFIGVWTAARVGVCLAPFSGVSNLHRTTNPHNAVCTAVAAWLGQQHTAYLHLLLPQGMGRDGSPLEHDCQTMAAQLRSAFGGALIVGGDLSAKQACALLDASLADAIAFTLPFVANPDLPQRLRLGIPWASPVPVDFGAGAELGYTHDPAAAGRDSDACI
ncbi:hypothetical protein [Variovorax sp. HJSM1_2]|uniref:oxidoreductase n=1 Tax=Variovorax sp. HJSM1_2 TaxID=3366263 RepID=UPI003BC1968B